MYIYTLLLVMLASFLPAPLIAEQIVIKGSTTLQPIVEKIAESYERDHPGSRIALSAMGSDTGIDALLSGGANIAASSRCLRTAEIKQAAEQGFSLVPHLVAYDAIIPIVHHSNPLKNISARQLREIYSGKIRNWKSLASEDRKIQAISRTPESGTYDTWKQKIMRNEQIYTSATMVVTTAEVVNAVSSQPGAIGYVGLGYLSASSRVKPLKVDGLYGSLKTVKDGSYLLSRPLFLFTRGWPQGAASKFIQYCQRADKGQGMVEQSGFIPAMKPD